MNTLHEGLLELFDLVGLKQNETRFTARWNQTARSTTLERQHYFAISEKLEQLDSWAQQHHFAIITRHECVSETTLFRNRVINFLPQLYQLARCTRAEDLSPQLQHFAMIVEGVNPLAQLRDFATRRRVVKAFGTAAPFRKSHGRGELFSTCLSRPGSF